MNKIIKVSAIVAFSAVILFGAVFFANSAFAWGSGDYGDGCCNSDSGSNERPTSIYNDDDDNGSTVTPPTCDISANVTSVKAGDTYRIEWNGTPSNANFTVNGHSVLAKDAATYEFNGANNTEKFVFKGNNAGGTCSDQVVIEKKDEPKTPTCEITANVTTVKAGDTYRIEWHGTPSSADFTVNGHSVLANDAATYTFDGSNNTEKFVFKGNNDGKTCSDKVVIEKKDEPKTPTCDYFTASDNHIDNGESVTLSWGTTNADSVSINQGIGSVADDGSKTVTPHDTTTFTLTVNGDGKKDNCSVTVKVDDDHDDPTPRCDYFTVSDDDVDEGDTVTLEWETTHATEVFINEGVGFVPRDGEEDVRVFEDTRFVLEARNGGEEDQCSVRVEVDEDDDEKRPRCELDISDDHVKVGDEVTLEWETDYADEVEIEDDHGNEIFDEDDLRTHDDGEVDVEITEDTEFTLTARGDGGTRECDIDVEVEDGEVLVLSDRDQQPRVSGISLTKVPYTGFEAGPMLTFLFYALLTGWALVVAYMLVVRKDTILGFSLAPASAGAAAMPVADHRVNDDEPQTETEPDTTYTESTASVAPANLPTGNTATIGYAAAAATATEETDELTQLEEYATTRNVLISSDALRYFRARYQNDTDEMEAFDALIAAAKRTFPLEDGWVVLNHGRMEQLLASDDGEETETEEQAQPEATVTDTGLTGAIVTGDIIGAYDAIAHRPMVALAEAAALLDAAYRARGGAHTEEQVPATLLVQLQSYSDDEIKTAVSALTSALDGTYSDEEAAVKIAVMKAVNVFTR